MIRRRSARGFSMFDAAIGALLFALLFTVIARFVLALGDTAEGSLSRANVRRQLDTANALLDADLSAAAACGDSRYATPVVQINAVATTSADTDGLGDGTVLFTTDVDADGNLDLVGWRVRDNSLQRREHLYTVAGDGSATCPADGLDFDESDDWKPIATGVRAAPDSDAYFAGIADGQRLAVSGICSDTEVALSCGFDSLAVQFASDGGDTDAGPVLFDRTYSIPDTVA